MKKFAINHTFHVWPTWNVNTPAPSFWLLVKVVTSRENAR